jgi:hypothetical protein
MGVLRRLLTFLGVSFFLACSASAPPPSSSLIVSVAAVNRGVPDRGMDPSVVVLEVLGGPVCSGVLIAPDVVLTARHCTSILAAGISCPAHGPQVVGDFDAVSIEVLLGDEVETAVVAATGLALVVPSTDVLCGADIALVLLDREITSVAPALVKSVGVAEGDHVRTVGYGDPPGPELLREHVPVVAAEAVEFRAAEATCEGEGGGPAFDEATGQVVGVLAEFSPSCASPAPFDVYTRTEVFYALIEEALDSSMEAGKKRSDTSTKDPTDYGGWCTSGADCGAGVCVEEGTTEYCSRSCSATDTCPTDFKCVTWAMGATPVCVEGD